MKIFFMMLFLPMLSQAAVAKDGLPRDIKNFIYNAGACEHLAGEFDGDLPKHEQDKILKNIDKYCRLAKIQLKSLERKYHENPKLLKIIKSNANEAVVSYQDQPA